MTILHIIKVDKKRNKKLFVFRELEFQSLAYNLMFSREGKLEKFSVIFIIENIQFSSSSGVLKTHVLNICQYIPS